MPGHTTSSSIWVPCMCLQAAVSTTFVQGTLSAQRAKAMSSRGRSINQEGGQRYTAAALSLVFHPAHPLVPTLRADVRRFEVSCHPSLLALPDNLMLTWQTPQIDSMPLI